MPLTFPQTRWGRDQVIVDPSGNLIELSLLWRLEKPLASTARCMGPRWVHRVGVLAVVQVPDPSLAGGRRSSTTFSMPLRARSAPPEASRPARVLAAYSAVSLATSQASSQPASVAPRTLSEVLAMGTLMLLRALRRRLEMVPFSSEAIWGWWV